MLDFLFRLVTMESMSQIFTCYPASFRHKGIKQISQETAHIMYPYQGDDTDEENDRICCSIFEDLNKCPFFAFHFHCY